MSINMEPSVSVKGGKLNPRIGREGEDQERQFKLNANSKKKKRPDVSP